MPISPKSAKAIADTVEKATKKASKRMSRAEGEAAGLYHPIGGGVKLSKPVSEYSFETIQDPRFSPQVKRFLSPEDFVGKRGVPLIGDRAAAGKVLVGVDGRPLQEGVAIEGGGEFMLNFPEIWASEKAAAKKIAKQVKKAMDSDKEVLGINVVGSPTNVDFNKMVSRTLLDGFDPTQLRKQDIEAFNADIRKKYPNFIGIEHPELKDYLLSPKMGNVRTKFVQTMNKAKYQEAGFPDVVAARIAVTEPKLIDVPTGSAGFTVGKFDPDRLLIENPDIPHDTYNTHLGGVYEGGLEAPLDFKDIFIDFSEARRMLGGDPTKDLRAFTFQSPAIQDFDQEWLDKVMPTYEQILKSKRYKKGGKVDLEAEFRKADMIAPRHFDEGGEAEKPQRKIELEEYIQQENLNTLLQELARRIQLSGEMAQSREGKQAFGRLGYRQPIGDDMSVGVGASGHYFKGDRFKNADVDRADMSLSKRFKDESELRARLGANLNEQMGKRGLDELMLEYEIPFKDGGNVQHFGPGGLARGANKIKEVTKKVLQNRGKYGVQRMERAADLVPNLEKQFDEDALYRAFSGDNAKGLMVMNPRSFESYSQPLWDEYVEPEYIRELAQIARQKGFEDVPFLMLGRKELKYIPKDLQELYIAGHEGRHRNRALSKLGDESTLIQLLPKGSLREDLPRLSQEEYIDALKKELGLNPLVRPEQDTEEIRRLIRLPEIFAKGGEVKGYKEGGDLEEEFRKADMIDMSGFRQDPLEKATRRADNRPKKQSSMSELNKRLNIAKEVGAELADEFKKSSAKEVKAATRSPKGAVDLLRNIASQYAAMAEDSPIIPTLTGSSQNELAKLALTAMKGKKALEKEYANRKPSDLMGKELSAYDMKTMGDGMLSKAIMGDAEPMPIVSTIVDFASPFAGRALAKGAKAIAPDVMRAIEKATVDPYKFNIVKPEGGQFIDSTLKENLKQLKQGDEDNQINKALDAWVDSTLRKYVVNRMGTESDEVRKLFDKGITHVDPEQLKGAPSARTLEQHRARLPGSGKRAETEVGQAWEDASDYSLYGRRRSSYDDRDVEKYPWLSKMAPEDMVYGASVDSSALKDRLGFGHVIDVIRGDLRSGKLRPEQLNKVSVEDAIKRTHAFNQEMAKKAEETAITVQSGMPVHREYPEGYKWVELKYTEPTDGLPKGYEVNVVDYGNGEKKYFASTPNTRSSAFETEEEAQQELERYAKNFKSFREKNKTQEMLTYEGDTMGHCVGSYCEDVMGGDTRIFSLRDSKGEPHVTIEVRAPSGYLKAKKATELRAQGMSAEEAELATENLGNEIVQIKGKGNAKPSAKYIPFVQDFVKNPVVEREWADVGDFRNTDFINANLLRKEGVMPDADTETMNTVLQELDRIYPMNKLPGGQREFVGEYGELLPTSDMLKTQIQDLTSPYLTKEDIINHLRSKEALPVEQSYSKYYENLPKDEGMAHGGDVHMAKGGFMGAVETAGKLGREGLRRFNDKLNKLSRNVAYNTYEQVPYTGAKHLEGMPGKSFESKLLFTEEAPWGSPEKDADLLAKYLGLESGQSQKGVGLYQPPIEGAPLEFNPQISSRTLVKSDKGRYNENLIAEPDKASMTALGATRGYLDVQGASPWVRPSQGSGRLYNGFHISLNGKPTEEEMRKIGEIQANYGFWGAGDLGKSGVYVGFNPEMTRDDLNKMQRAFRKDIKEALGDRVAGVKMMKSEGDYPAFEEAWKAPQGTGTVTRQLMEYLDTAKEKNPLLAEYYAQKPSTELQKLMQEMNIRDIKAPEKYGVGAPREDVMKARDIFSEYGIEGLRDALNRGEYLPAAVAIPSGIELFKDDN